MKLLIVLAILIGGCSASEWNDSTVMEFGNLSYMAGHAAAWASIGERLVENDVITYEKYSKNVRSANALIRKYNRFLIENFNESFVDLNAIAEYPMMT